MPFIIKKNTKIYHGSGWNCDSKPFTFLDKKNSDFDVSWISLKEDIAKDFSSDRFNPSGSNDNIPIIFQGTIQNNLKLVQFETDCIKKQGKECFTLKDLMDEYGIKDPREMYKFVDKSKYDGVIASGNIGYNLYDDIALFNPDQDIKLEKIKFRPQQNKEWSDFYEIDDLEEKFQDFCNKK